MSKLQNAFSHGKAFIPFITAGDPSLDVTEELIYAMEEAGANLIEIGIPFSDPVAEGVVIQKASKRALLSGTTTEKIFGMVERIRKNTDIPLAFMTYLNPILAYGKKQFLNIAGNLGMDALIVPDMPFEEQYELLPECRANNIDLISLIAPTSKERIAKIAAGAQGFVYCVSSMGTTGVREKFSAEIKNMVAQVKEIKDIPCAVGFGISTPQQAREIASFSDGVIVGSAIVRIVEQYGSKAINHVRDYVRSMKEAIKE